MIDPSQLFGFIGWSEAVVENGAQPPITEERRLTHDGKLVMHSCFERDDLGRCVKETRFDELGKPVISVCYHANNGHLSAETCASVLILNRIGLINR